MPTTLTPLRYPGGKSKYFPLFAEVLELNALEGCTFAETFAGGAGAAVSLLLKGHVRSLILNDLDSSIFAFWKAITETPEEFIRLIERTTISVEEWRRQKDSYDVCDSSDQLSLGFATFFLNRCNRAGILGARPIGGMAQEGNYSISSRFNKATSIRKVEAIAERASSIQLFNLDGAEFLRVLARDFSDHTCAVYLDPPYYQKGPELYMNHFKHADHQALRDEIVDCPFPWILTYDAHEEIMNLYRDEDCRIYRNRLRHTITGNRMAEELIISRMIMPKSLRVARSTI